MLTFSVSQRTKFRAIRRTIGVLRVIDPYGYSRWEWLYLRAFRLKYQLEDAEATR